MGNLSLSLHEKLWGRWGEILLDWRNRPGIDLFQFASRRWWFFWQANLICNHGASFDVSVTNFDDSTFNRPENLKTPIWMPQKNTGKTKNRKGDKKTDETKNVEKPTGVTKPGDRLHPWWNLRRIPRWAWKNAKTSSWLKSFEYLGPTSNYPPTSLPSSAPFSSQSSQRREKLRSLKPKPSNYPQTSLSSPQSLPIFTNPGLNFDYPWFTEHEAVRC